MTFARPTTLVDGFLFGEGPRWHGGRFWFSDMFGGKVLAVDAAGEAETILTLDDRTSGLGWDTQGRLLVVSMGERKLLRWDGDKLEVHADLSALVDNDLNDMLVTREGRAYCGNLGYDILAGEQPRATQLVAVEADGSARVVADGLTLPNGMVLTPDEKTLVMSETFADRLTAFDVAADGGLSNRRTFAELTGMHPDGICLDADGAIWVACFGADQFIRVHEGGEISARIPVEGRRSVACMLGGADRRTLYLCTAVTTIEELHAGRSHGRIEIVQVDVPGAGWS